jgi:antitoxin ParD1/3/4
MAALCKNVGAESVGLLAAIERRGGATMSNVAKISVALTPELAALVNQAVESGEYATGSEVIREALREWNRRRGLLQREDERLRALWAEGLASGPGCFESKDAIKAEARRQLMEELSNTRG